MKMFFELGYQIGLACCVAAWVMGLWAVIGNLRTTKTDLLSQQRQEARYHKHSMVFAVLLCVGGLTVGFFAIPYLLTH